MRFFLFSKLLFFPTFSCENLVTESQRCLPECLHWNAESLSLLPSFLLVIISLLTVYHLLFLTTVSVVVKSAVIVVFECGFILLDSLGTLLIQSNRSESDLRRKLV